MLPTADTASPFVHDPSSWMRGGVWRSTRRRSAPPSSRQSATAAPSSIGVIRVYGPLWPRQIARQSVCRRHVPDRSADVARDLRPHPDDPQHRARHRQPGRLGLRRHRDVARHPPGRRRQAGDRGDHRLRGERRVLVGLGGSSHRGDAVRRGRQRGRLRRSPGSEPRTTRPKGSRTRRSPRARTRSTASTSCR